MILTNYKVIKRLLSMVLPGSAASGSIYKLTVTSMNSNTFATKGGTEKIKTFSGSTTESSQYTLTNIFTDILVGTGNTAASESDYCLANDVTSTFSTAVATTRTYSSNSVIVSKSITNNTSASVTINELGVMTGSGNVAILLTRTVLESPITVEAGQTVAINVTFSVTE